MSSARSRGNRISSRRTGDVSYRRRYGRKGDLGRWNKLQNTQLATWKQQEADAREAQKLAQDTCEEVVTELI